MYMCYVEAVRCIKAGNDKLIHSVQSGFSDCSVSDASETAGARLQADMTG